MYDFLLQEEWWMQEIIGAALAAGATLIAAVLMYSSRINKLVDQLEQVKGMLDKESQKRFDEHGRLSGEHKELSGEHRELKDEIHRVIVYQESEKTARETAAKKLPDESGLVKMVNAVFTNNKKLLQKNMKLNARLEILQKENAQLKEQVRAFQNDREDSLEINDMDLFDELDDDMEL